MVESAYEDYHEHLLVVMLLWQFGQTHIIGSGPNILAYWQKCNKRDPRLGKILKTIVKKSGQPNTFGSPSDARQKPELHEPVKSDNHTMN